MNQASSVSSGVTRDTRLPIRWVVLFTGFKATQDYQPASSEGEPEALVKEVTQMCVAFHPHTDIRLFPQDSEALLYWRAKSTGDWVVTRVSTAPNPEGLRTALEYSSVVFSDAEFAKLWFNPFRALELGLHDRVREQFLGQKFAPVPFELLPQAMPGGRSGANGAGAGDRPDIGDSLSTPENVAALREFCNRRQSDPPTPPPTFASWWSSGGQPPAGYFDIVLRASAPKALTLRDAADAAAALAAETKGSLPNAPAGDAVASDLSRSILASVDAVVSAVGEAGSRINVEGPDQFRARLEDAARSAAKAASDLVSYQRRLEGAGGGAALADIAARFEALGRDLPKVRHPNPFASRPNADTGKSNGRGASTFSTATGQTGAGTKAAETSGGGKPGMNPVLIAAPIGLVAVALIGWKLMAGGGAPGGGPVPKQGATKAGNGGATQPAVSPIAAALQKQQQAVAADAKKRARGVAEQAAGKKGGDLDEAGLEKVTFDAIKSAYLGKMPEAEYQKAFSGGTLTYGKLQQIVPGLVTSVHESAVLGMADAKVRAATTAAEKKAAQARAEAQAKLEEQARQAKADAAAQAAAGQREREREAERERERAAEREKERERERERERQQASRRSRDEDKPRREARKSENKPSSKPSGNSGGGSGAGSAAAAGL